jgi:Holliday junction resolvase RusA-like endonuclease
MSEQISLPNLGPAPLVPGPVFVCFEIVGKPPHKGRHRSRLVIPREAWTVTARGDRFMSEASTKKIFIQQYPDPDTEAHEAVLAEIAGLYMRGKTPTEKPVALLVHAFVRIPESWPRRDREAALSGVIRPASRPDWDNYGKITDALNGVVWKDDSQVVDGRSIKRYSDRPALRIEIREFVVPGTIT